MKKISTYLKWFINTVFLFSLICFFVPLYPSFPTDGMDPSWVFSLTKSITNEFMFGRDIVFTFGPYANIITRQFVPSMDLSVIWVTIYLSLCYWVCFNIVFIKSFYLKIGLTIFILIGVLHSINDTVIFLYPVLLGFVILKRLHSESIESLWDFLTLFVLSSPFGLFPYIKVSYLISTVIFIFFTASYFFICKKKKLIIIPTISIFLSIIFFWILARQSISGLFSYFKSNIPIISGYTEAMSLGDFFFLPIFFFIVTSAFLVTGILFSKSHKNIQNWFLSFLVATYLFISFKSGFVRADGHIVTAGFSLLLISILLFKEVNSKIAAIGLLFGFMCWAYMDSLHNWSSVRNILSGGKNVYLSFARAIEKRRQHNNWPMTEFESVTKTIHEKIKLPNLKGTSDIYSYNQSYLLASGNQWNPRPVFQSYAAYMPDLINLNSQHLLSKSAPDNIFFKLETIDTHLYSLDDGASWPILLAKYLPEKEISDYVLLRKRDNQLKNKSLSLISEQFISMDSTVKLPEQYKSKLIFAKLDIAPNLLGRLVSTVYKSSQLYITLNLENGFQNKYRIIYNMARTEFLISPLVETTEDFVKLYGGVNLFSNKKIKSFTISSDNGPAFLWKKEMKVRFYEADSPDNMSSINPFLDSLFSTGLKIDYTYYPENMKVQWGDFNVVPVFGGAFVSSNPVFLSKGPYHIIANLTGTPAMGEFPKVEMMINDKVVSEFDVTSDFKDYKIAYMAKEDLNAVISIRLKNDLLIPGKEDRNAFIKSILFNHTK